MYLVILELHSKTPLTIRKIMTHLESNPSTIHQTLLEENGIRIESQLGDIVDLLYKLATFLSKPVSWEQAVIK